MDMAPASMHTALAVHPWPQCQAMLAGRGAGCHDPLLIRIDTDDTTLRDAARAQIRHVLRDLLGMLFDVPAASVALTSIPGEPIQCRVRGHRIHLSVSHDAGMSVAALSLRGKVGVDIMRLPAAFEWEAVARDYLGPDSANHLMRLAPARQLVAFAQAWTGLEAKLKCAGVGLTEWSTAREEKLSGYQTQALALPGGWIGNVAAG